MFKPSDLATLHRMQEAADRTRVMIHRRAVEAYHAAFASIAPRDANLDMCIIHNSILSAEGGQPWREINYSHMRRARWLTEQSYKPSLLVTKWYRRKCQSR